MSKSNKNILITGVNGFTAHHLVPFLLKKGYKIIGIDKKTKYTKQKITYYQANLQNQTKLLTILIKHKPVHIYHLAGVFKAQNEKDFIVNNFNGTLNLLSTIIKIKKYQPHILLVGSFAEYGNLSKNSISETDAGEVVNPYGLSKKLQTALGLYFAEKHNLSINIVRPTTLVGPGAPTVMLTGNLIKQIKQNKKIIDINNMDITRDSLDVRDAVRLYHLVNTSDLNSEIVNACSGIAVTNREVATWIQKQAAKLLNRQIKFNENFTAISPIKISVGSNQKAKKLFKWQPKISWKDSITDMIKS